MVVVPPVVIMPKPVAARPATVESSAMRKHCCTGRVRLKSAPRVVGAPPHCQVALDDFFTTDGFWSDSSPVSATVVAARVEFFA